MTRIISILLTLAVLLPSAGCIVHSGPRHHNKSSASSSRCHPSEHWDGHQCRHNGKGKGARKHDHR